MKSALVEKKYVPLINKDQKIKAIRGQLEKYLSVDQATSLAGSFSTINQETNPPGKVIEIASAKAKEAGFKFQQEILEEIFKNVDNRDLVLSLVRPNDHAGQFERLLTDIPSESRTIIERAIDPEQLIAIMAREGDNPLYMMMVVVEMDGYIWNVQPPEKTFLDSGAELDEFETSNLFTDILIDLCGGKIACQGGVVVKGPKGGTYNAGEVLGGKERAAKSPPIQKELKNGYSVTLFG